jgi:peptide/nickel transport system ATP-binding protein
MADSRPRGELIVNARALRIQAGAGVLLEDVSFSVAPREILVLTGETGAGKTSLLDALSGMSPHALRGDLEILGEDALFPESLLHMRGRNLGVLQQDIRGWYTPYRRIGSQILEGWTVNPVTGRALVGSLLDRFALPIERIWSRFPNQLSDGMLRRVALAGLLAREPELVIADEPTAGLDGPTRWRTWELLLESGAAVVAATHDIEQIKAMADSGWRVRVALIAGGTLLIDEPSED